MTLIEQTTSGGADPRGFVDVLDAPTEADDWDDLPARPFDPLDHVQSIGVVIGSFLAERAGCVAQLWHDAVRDAEMFGSDAAGIVERSVRLELAAAMRITEHAAGDLLRRSCAMVERYPIVLTALGESDITERHADLLVDALDGVEPEFRDPVLAEALPLACAQPVGTFRRVLRELVERVRAVTLEARHDEAVQRRRIALEEGIDGMGWLGVHAPMAELRAAYDRATALAKAIKAGDPDDPRTLDQLRADVVGDLLVDGDTRLHPKRARGIQATVAVTVPALSLLDDAAAADAPATVEGVGPIPIEKARELCGGAKGWMRVLTHPETGIVLSVGRKRYRPPAPLRRFVQWRAGRCMAPGCNMPAERCQIDHSIAWEEGGETSDDNLCPLCQGHHTIKHHGRWRVRQVGDGVIEWTSPTGRVYLVEPRRRFPRFTADGPPADGPPAGESSPEESPSDDIPPF